MIDNEQDPLVSGVPGFHALHTQLREELKNSSEKGNISTPVPVLNIDDSIFKKMENKESFSSDDVYKIITAISKKESSKKMIETFTSNLKIMAEESKQNAEPIMDPKPLASRQLVSGRNAFEIREDILEAAIDVVKFSNSSSIPKKDSSTMANECLQIAAKFYEFVENKNHRR